MYIRCKDRLVVNPHHILSRLLSRNPNVKVVEVQSHIDLVVASLHQLSS